MRPRYMSGWSNFCGSNNVFFLVVEEYMRAKSFNYGRFFPVSDKVCFVRWSSPNSQRVNYALMSFAVACCYDSNPYSDEAVIIQIYLPKNR